MTWFAPAVGSVVGYEVAVQPQGSLVPSGSGQHTGIATSNFLVTNLAPATQYQYWVRSECTSGVFSAWTGPMVFNTQICLPSNQCTYTFRMTDSANHGWNGARMQIRQNGIVVSTIGNTYISGAGPIDVPVTVCNDLPFDIFWSAAGSQPQQCIVSVINSFGQTIATINGNAATVNSSIYSGVINCDVPLCTLAPSNVSVNPITTTGGTINWNAPGTANVGFDIYIVPSGQPAPTHTTLPTFSGINGPSAPFLFNIPTPNGLLADTPYDFYVRVQCEPTDSPWSSVATFTTAATCSKPTNQNVTGITLNSATLGWTEAASATQWEVLLLAAPDGMAPPAPLATPIVGASDIFIQNSTATTVSPALTTATIYHYYVRSICQPGNDKSTWTGPFIFNTLICNETDKCTYKFLLTNATNNNWNFGRMQVRQNEIVVATLGTGEINNANGISVALCNDAPFDLYWNVAGQVPQAIGVSIVDVNNDIVFTQLAGQGAPLTVLYSDTTLGNCLPPTCPKPTNLSAIVTATLAQLSWTETGSATQWEVYVAEIGMPEPVNGTPVVGIAPYFLANENLYFTISNLLPSTNYTYYVRAICSPTDVGNWTILNPKTFTTTPLNDECSASITIPVNPTPEVTQTIAGSTVGGTASVEISACPGVENDDVWFSFVATNNAHILKLINVVNATNATIRYAVYLGADCTTLNQIYCSPSMPSSNVLSSLVVGQTYKIRVYTNENNAVVQISSFEIAVTTPPPITNDECATAIPLTVNEGVDCNQVTAGSVTGATASSEIGVCTGSGDDDVWFSFVATSQRHILTLSDIVGTATDLNNTLYVGTICGNLALISCNVDDQTILNNLVVGSTYKIRVWSASSLFEDIQFNICIGRIPPPIIANTTQYTVPQLVNDVLINSLCSTIANITWATGTNPGINGIGYFNKGNSDFPFQQGIILSTGNAAAVVGPNTSILSGGGAGGDADLSAILAAQTPPVTGTLNNATKLEFDFVAVSNQINFNFLFASEEYGPFQCAFGDAFAFILTDLTAGTPPVNLAVLPGTNVPVTIFNIRDGQYNAACPSSNLAYFGNYFANPAGVLGAPINFNGITVPMTAGATVISGNSYHIKMVIADYQDTHYDSAVFLQGGSFNFGEDHCTDKIKLIAFNDTNSNGIKEDTETSFTYGAFQYLLNDTPEIHNLSSPIGAYTIFDQNPLNSYDFTFNVHPEYATYFSAGTTNINNINIAAGSGTQTLYFPITQLQGYNDVTVSLIPIGQPTAGFNYSNKIVYQNLGTAATSGTISYTKDAAVTLSSSDSGVTINPTGFTYNFANLAAFETRQFNVSLSVPSIPVVNIGDVLSSSVQISAPNADINANNNAFSLLQTVVASYDPNDKMEAHGEELDFNTFTQNDYLFYTIRFQNTGTTNAITVRIEDLLDAQLDEESLRMISASHYYQLERIGNQLVWKFPGINLPSIIQNEELSNGYLTFKIKVKPGFAIGDIIPNFAEIYFDTNPPIITNTFMSEFVVNLGTQAFSTNNILLYPNPTNSLLNINLQGTNESLAKIVIYDVVGKTVLSLSANNTQQTSINVGSLAKGMYLIEITTDTNLKQVRKFIVN